MAGDPPGERHQVGCLAEYAGPTVRDFRGLADQLGSEGLTIYFATDDMDATLDKVREAGGTVENEKMPVPGMGWFAPIKDTEGNRFSFWQVDENAPVPAGMQSGEAAGS